MAFTNSRVCLYLNYIVMFCTVKFFAIITYHINVNLSTSGLITMNIYTWNIRDSDCFYGVCARNDCFLSCWSHVFEAIVKLNFPKLVAVASKCLNPKWQLHRFYQILITKSEHFTPYGMVFLRISYQLIESLYLSTHEEI